MLFTILSLIIIGIGVFLNVNGKRNMNSSNEDDVNQGNKMYFWSFITIGVGALLFLISVYAHIKFNKLSKSSSKY